ncbi:hypothetical protein DD595_25085 [Enterobacter cloacae complex sp. 4DZ3-17B2]|nr:hypothetical protein DD595_25085 [Enterobacter cloacae complex sp. 4DZ3-17B2]
MTKFVTERETVTMDETLAAAKTFRIQTKVLIPLFPKKFVINTDQTGKCQVFNFNNTFRKFYLEKLDFYYI